MRTRLAIAALLVTYFAVAFADPGNPKISEFAGTWQGKFNGNLYVTLKLTKEGDHLTGTITNFDITTDPQGNLTAATVKQGESQVSEARIADGALLVVVKDSGAKDGDDTDIYRMTLTSTDAAEFAPQAAVADGNAVVKPLKLERAK